jgi:hypothetical protein
MGPTLRFHELEEGSQKPPYPRFALPKTCDPDLSSYFPNSFSGQFVNKGRGGQGESGPDPDLEVRIRST